MKTKALLAVLIFFAIATFASCRAIDENIKKEVEIENQKNNTLNEDTQSNALLKEESLYAANLDKAIDIDAWRMRDIKFLNEDNISKEMLCSTIWKYNPSQNDGFLLVFYLDDECRIGTEKEGMKISGKYKILEDNKLELYALSSLPEFLYNAIKLHAGKAILTLTTNKSDIFYTKVLVSENENQYFGAFGSEAIDKEEKIINGQYVIIDKWKAVTTQRLKFREKPDISSNTQKVDFSGIIKENAYTHLDYFMKGTTLDVIARTKEKSKVNTSENYWYYISYQPKGTPIYGWVYGEYLTQFDEAKKDEYDKIIQSEIEFFTIKEE